MLGACGGSARVLTHDDDGGLFALEGDRAAAREDAERQMRAHCGAAGFDVVFEGDVQVGEEETHERSASDRVAQTQTEQSGDHTSWVEGTDGAYGQSGVQVSTDGDVALYDAHRGERGRRTRTVTARHLEYECEATSGGEREDAPER